MKKNKVWAFLSFLFWGILAAAEIYIGAKLLELDMLPSKYLMIVLGVLLLIAILMALLMYRRDGKYQKKKSHARQVIAYILSLVIAVCCFVGGSAIDRVSDTISAVTKDTLVSAVVDVYVLTDDPAQAIEDAGDYHFAVTDSYDWENTQSAIQAVEDQLGVTIRCTNYSSVFEMVDALLAKEVDALFLNSAYLDILEDMDGYSNFSSDTRVIYEHIIKAEADGNDPNEISPDAIPTPKFELVDENNNISSFIVYLSGSDTRSKVLNTSRSDVNILAVVNPQTKQILLVNTPRDYYIVNPAGNGSKDKLTHCGLYGIDCSISALEDLYGADIVYYAQINFTGFETLVDAIGGVTVYSEISFTTTHGGYKISAGNNTLTGAQALSFARERYAYTDGDNQRGQNQMKIITAIVDQLSAGTIISNYAQILDSLEGMFTTNMSQSDISTLVKMQIEDMASWDILSYAATGTNSSGVTYSIPGREVYVMIPNQSTVDRASELIDMVLSGKTITSADLS